MLIASPFLQVAAIVAGSQAVPAPAALPRSAETPDPIALAAVIAKVEAAEPEPPIETASADPDAAGGLADEADGPEPGAHARHRRHPAVEPGSSDAPAPIAAADPVPLAPPPPAPAPARQEPVVLAAVSPRDSAILAATRIETERTAAAAPPPPPAEPVRIAAMQAQDAPAPAAIAPADLPPSAAAAPPEPTPERSGVPAPPESGPPVAPAPSADSTSPAPPADAAAPAGPGSAADADEALLPGRRRPGAPQVQLPDRVTQDNAGAVRAPPPEAFPDRRLPGAGPLADRADALSAKSVLCEHRGGMRVDPRSLPPEFPERRPADRPEAQAVLPADHRDDWFLNVSATSDTIVEPRSFPTPVGVQTTSRPGSLDTFGRANSFVFAQTFIGSVSLIKGSTAYKPPEIEYRLTLAYQENYARVNERRVLFVEPSRKPHRLDGFVGVQEAFVDKHLRNVSDRYDFDSVRVGIQPFQADFRGFLFNDNQLGIRFFGNRDNNRFQYNLAGFWRLEKDTNSGLNIVTERPRDDVVLFANVYRQDFPIPGLTTQLSATLNFNREKDNPRVDDNGFPARPALLGTLRGRNYDVGYLGLGTDGRIGRINLTTVAYLALGEDRNNFFNDEKSKIRAYFGAAEASYDVDWIRFRLSALYASGDRKAYDKTEGGFDAIFENPVFAGADTSYFIRQSVPFAGGGRAVGLKQRNGLLNDLRTSKEEGQSNFNNPGTVLVGVGADLDVTPDFRISPNLNHLWFANTAVMQALRVEGSIPRDIGWDLSAAAIYRPHFNQNLVFRLSGAVLEPGKGFKDLFGNSDGDKRYHSVLFNAILTF